MNRATQRANARAISKMAQRRQVAKGKRQAWKTSQPAQQDDSHELTQRIAKMPTEAARFLDRQALTALAIHEGKFGAINQKHRRLRWLQNERHVILRQRDADAERKQARQRARSSWGVNPDASNDKRFARSLQLGSRRAAAGL